MRKLEIQEWQKGMPRRAIKSLNHFGCKDRKQLLELIETKRLSGFRGIGKRTYQEILAWLNLLTPEYYRRFPYDRTEILCKYMGTYR